MSKITKKTVKIFPDYCSTGVWVDGGNADPESLGISEGLRIALDYWHQYWEDNLSGIWDKSGNYIASTVGVYWKKKWIVDGHTLVRLMNEENVNYEFTATFNEDDL